MSAPSSNNLELRRFTIDNLIVFSRIVGMSVFAIAISAILARDLGKTGKGEYELVMLLTNLLAATLFNLGLPLATTYYTATKLYDLKTILSTNIAILCILIPLAILTGLGVILLGGQQLFGDVPQAYLFIGVFIIPFFMIDQILNNMFGGLQDFRSMGMVDVAQPLTMALLLVGLLVTQNLNTLSALLAVAVSYLAANTLAIYLLRTKVDSWRDFWPRLDRKYARDLIVYGLKIYSNVIIGRLLLRVDLLLITNLGGGPASVGVYSIAVTLAERVWTFSGFTSNVLMPRIASWHNEDDRRNQLTLLVAKYSLWVSILAGIALVVFGRWAINLLYGSEFDRSFTAMMYLLPGILMYNFTRIFGSDAIGRGRGGYVTPIVVAALILNTILNIVLIPPYDFIGAAIASSAAYTLYAFLLMWFFFHNAKMRWLDMILPTSDDIRRFQSLFKILRTRFARR